MSAPQPPPSDPAGLHAKRRVLLLGAGVAALAFVRFRRTWPAWQRFHAWLADQGVPHEIRNLDASVIFLAVAFGASLVLARGSSRSALARLGLLEPVGRALLVAVLCTAPMFLASALAGGSPRPAWSLVRSAGIAPVVEEVFFRGLLLMLLVRSAGTAFWPVAVLQAVLFGLGHVSWTAPLTTGQLGVALVTAAGGVWFAWLLRCWRWNLWVPILLHALMNLAWLLFDVADDAVGGLGANIGRAATITVATVVTLRPSWLGLPRAWTEP